MQEKFIQTTTGGKIYYWINKKMINSDNCIVFCHGLTADHSLFDMQIDAFKDMNQMLLLDIPLHGKSIPYQNFSFNNVVTDIETILQKENISKVILVGQSAGGYIAQAFIDKYPNKVLGFVGIGTTPLNKEYYKKSDLFWIKHFTTIARLYPYKYYCKASSKSVTYTIESQKSFYNTLLRLGKKGMLQASKAVYGDFLNQNYNISFPCFVLLIVGEHDNTGYVKKYNKEWAEKTGYPLVILQNASHNANYDNFTEFNKLLKKYIEKLSNNT